MTLVNPYHTASPTLRQLHDRKARALAEIEKLLNRAKSGKHSAGSSSSNADKPRQTVTSGFSNEILKDEDGDWNFINWKEEEKDSQRATDNTGAARSSAGFVRRGLFG